MRATHFGARAVSRLGAHVRQTGPRLRAAIADGYAKYAVAAASVLTLLLAIRVSEIVPGASAVRPVVVASLISGYYFLTKTRKDVLLGTLRDPVVVVVALYGLIAMAGVPFALMGSLALKNLTAMLFGFILTISILLMPPTLKALERYTLTMVGGAMIVSGMWLVIGRAKAGGRLTSSGSYDPNDLASMMCLFLPLALGMIFRGSIFQRLVGLMSAGIFVVLLVLTSSRGGIIGFAVIMLTFMFVLRPTRAVVATIFVGPLILIGFSMTPESFRKRATSLTNVEDDYNMTLETGRIAIWKRGWMHFKGAPLLGVGIGNYSVAEGNFFQSTNKVAAYFTAHNTYIQAFVELGFFGGCALLWLVYSTVKGTWAASRSMYNGIPNPAYRPEYIASMTGYFSCAFFLSHAFVYLLFAAIGIGIFVRNVQSAAVGAGPPATRPAR